MRAYNRQLKAKAVEVKKYLPELCKENIFSSNSNIFTAAPVEQKKFTNLYDLFHKDNVKLNLHSINWPINCSYKPDSIYITTLWYVIIFMDWANARSSHRSCSMKKTILKSYAKFTEKHLCWSLFLNKVTNLRPAILSQKDSAAGFFLWGLQNFKNTYSITSGWLLLKFWDL